MFVTWRAGCLNVTSIWRAMDPPWMVMFMNKWRNLPLSKAVLILFQHRHLIICRWCRRTKTDFILLYSFLYALFSTSDTSQPSSVPVYSSHSFLMHSFFILVYFPQSHFSSYILSFAFWDNATVIVMGWVSLDGHVSRTSFMSLRTGFEHFISAMKILKWILTLPHQNDRLDSPNWLVSYFRL